MANELSGTWKMISSEHFEDYMKALGVNAIIRKMASLAKPKAVIQINGDDYLYQSVSSVRKVDTRCTLGKEFEEDIPDGRKTKSLIILDGNKLIHTQKWEGKQTTILRFVDNSGHLIMEFTFDGVTCRRVFKRV